MIVTMQWLADYLDLSGLSADVVAERLTAAGLEVAGVRRLGAELAEIVVAEILSRDPHPNADKLSLCRVTDGAQEYGIVCGADNMKAGDRVALARVGVALPPSPKFPEGLTLKRAKIRGETSEGMMCSEEELGLSDASEGILILPPDLPLGASLPEALGIADTAIEIELTPNRGDCLSVRGIARELAALLGRPLRRPERPLDEKGPAVESLASVEVREPDLCPRYTARVVRGVRVGPSPEWLQRRLEGVGLRPINNVVDATNYVMWDLGQPLHAFDLGLLEERRIVVRRAAPGESLELLDGSEQRLADRDLVIADARRPVALAGVMGGANSEISEATTDLLLESAAFHPASVRRTARALGVHSDSSHRFERGVDFEAVPEALDRVAALIAEIGGGEVAAGRIDVHPNPRPAPEVRLRAERVRDLLGAEIADDEIAGVLAALGVALAPEGPGLWSARAPSWRGDLTREADLIEEVVRVRGYDRIEAVLPRGALGAEQPLAPLDRLEGRVRRTLAGLGLREAINLGFQSAALWDRLGLAADDPLRRMIEIRNPMVQDQRYLRTSLLPGLATNVATNQRFGTRDVALFEIGRVAFKLGPASKREVPTVAIALAGAVRGGGWIEKEIPTDFYAIKGIVESLLEALSPRAALGVERGGASPLFHPARSARLVAGDRVVGGLGAMHPDAAAHHDIAGDLWAAELDLEALAEALPAEEALFKEIPRFPSIVRDVTVQIDRGVEARAVVEAIEGQRVAVVREVRVVDLYEGPPVPEGRRALTLRVVYQDPQKTLTDAKINATHEKIVERMLQRVGGSLGS